MVNTMSVRELRPQLARVMSNIHDRFDRYVITKRGKPEVVMMSIEDYEGLLETLDIQSDRDLMKKLKQAQKDVKAGKFTSLEDIKKRYKLV